MGTPETTIGEKIQRGLLEVRSYAIGLLEGGNATRLEQDDALTEHLGQQVGHVDAATLEELTGVDRYDYSGMDGLSAYYSGPRSKSDHRARLQRTEEQATEILNRRLDK